MGCSCYYMFEKEKIKKRIKNDIDRIDRNKEKYQYKIADNNKSIEKEKNIILNKIKNEKDLNIRKEIDTYYNLLIKEPKIKDEYHLDTLNEEKNELNDLDKELDQSLNKSLMKNIKNKHNTIKKKLSNIFDNELGPTPEEKDSLYDYLYEYGEEFNEKQNLINFCDLYDEIANEINDLKEKKENFNKELFECQNELIFSSIEKKLNSYSSQFEKSADDFEKNLNSYKNEIKTIIKMIINKEINSNEIKNKYNDLKNAVQNGKNNLNNLKEKLLAKKSEDFDNALINYRESQITSKINDLKNVIGKMMNLKKDLNNKFPKWNNLNSLITQKENQNYFISFQIRDLMEQMNGLKKFRDKINVHINSINNQIKKINEINNSFDNLEEENELKILESPTYYKSVKKYNNRVSEIDDMKRKAEQIINDANNLIKDNDEFLDIEKNIKELTKDYNYILSDSDKEIKDQIYLKLKEKEKKVLKELFCENKSNVEKKLLNDNEFKYIPQIDINIINKIYMNEKIDDFCENKIIKEIETISNNDEKFKINHLTILMVGRQGIGKTTLIKYMLELSDDEINKMNNVKEDFKPFTSKKVKYLKLIEVKGIGFDDDRTPESIKESIRKYIDNSENQNFDSVINCIWYCFSGTRFEKEEKSLFHELQKIYQDNNIPIILVFTKSTEKKRFELMKEKLENVDKIKNDCIEVMAKRMALTRGKPIESFGKEELLKTTLMKCKEAFKGDMMKIMTQQISNDITKMFIRDDEKTMENIIRKTFTDFAEKYTETLGDKDFFLHITNLFLKYLSDFYDLVKNTTNKSKNLFLKSDFISSINRIYVSYKEYIKKLIKSDTDKNSKEFIEMQANLEKDYGNMEINNRRNLDEFKKTSEIFLKKNYYFIIQNYIINFIINSQNNYLRKFLESFLGKIKYKFQTLGNLNNRDEISIKIRKYLEYCFKKKLTSFSEKNNIQIDNEDKQELSKDNISFVNNINLQDNQNDVQLENKFKNSDSLIFYKINNNSLNQKTKPLILYKFKFQNEDKSYLLNEELNLKMKTFIIEINPQKYIKTDFENNDFVFNYFLNEIQENMMYYFNMKQYNYLEEIKNNYNKYNKNNKLIFKKNEIKSKIEMKNIEELYQKDIHNSLVNNYFNTIKLEYITIILTGKSGVGKSTLINCLTGKKVAEEGIKDVCTMNIQSYKLYFLNLIDTRGYEINSEYPPKKAKEDVISKIKTRNAQNNYNEFVHCIWFCVNANRLDATEKNVLKELKNNEYNIPLIVVFTNAQNYEDVQNMKKEINGLFHEDIFIDVLGRRTENVEEYGLDDLINKTFRMIKLNNKSNYYCSLKNKYKKLEKERLTEQISNIKKNILNKIVEEFILNFSNVKTENDFEEFIKDLLKKIIIFFSNDDNNKNIKIKFQINKEFSKYIQSCNKIYTQITQNLINEIIEKKSLEIIDLQVNIERMKNTSINQRNKKNIMQIKNLITQFLKDNFHYLAQKYLIYKFINNIFEDFIDIIEKIILEKIDDILEKDSDILNIYKNIYIKIFENYEKKVDKFRDENNNIYGPNRKIDFSNFNNINPKNDVNPSFKSQNLIKENFGKTSIKSYFDSKPLIGLQNLGCSYINATLQCMCNIETLADYFFNLNLLLEKKFRENDQDIKLCTLFKTIVDNLYPKYKTGKMKNENIEIIQEGNKEEIKGYFSPYEFGNKLSQLNALFKYIELGEPKDLLEFLLLTLHKELNKNSLNQYQEFNKFSLEERSNKQLMLKIFNKYFIQTHQSIISELFYAINYNVTQCCSCNNNSYTYKYYFLLKFPIEEVKNFKFSKNNRIQKQNNYINYSNNFNNNSISNTSNNIMNIENQNEINIIDCFEFDKKVNILSGDKAIYCNNCNKICSYSICNLLATGPKILIFILEREKKQISNIKLNFTPFLDLSNYIELKETGCQYELIGVITNIEECGIKAHFISFCKEYWNNTWLKFNDSVVEPVKNLQSEVIDFGEPYLLFYQKVNNKNN